MRRTLPCLLPLLLLVTVAAAAPLDREQREATVRYVNNLQNEDGGFRPHAGEGPSQLGATTAAIRALKYFGGAVRRKDDVLKFVTGSFNPTTGAFSNAAGTTPDVVANAMGLMALADLGAAPGRHGEAVIAYFNRNAQSPSDRYMAAAALDTARLKAPFLEEWRTAVEASRKPDGSFGEGVHETATGLINTLRLGGAVKERDAALRILRAGQRADGGFLGRTGATASSPSDLSSTYRVMRAFHLLKEKPDLQRLREFVARCRNVDGGYGPRPGEPSTVSATYNAGIVLHWADEMEKN